VSHTHKQSVTRCALAEIQRRLAKNNWLLERPLRIDPEPAWGLSRKPRKKSFTCTRRERPFVVVDDLVVAVCTTTSKRQRKREEQGDSDRLYAKRLEQIRGKQPRSFAECALCKTTMVAEGEELDGK
jgi:hypothetical protein